MELNKKVIIRADRAGVFYGTIIRKDGDEVDFCIEKWAGKFRCYVISQIKLDSVHQLQQILRLCGLNDLADNFKV